MAPLLEIKNIETYYDLIYAIRGVSLAIEERSVTAILGNNGAGKSTILKTLMGMLDDQPDKGSIEFMGQRIDGMDTEDIVRLGIGYVPEGREIFEELTVRENLLMGAYLRKDRSAIKQDIERVFSYFPILRDRTNQWAGTLSGGEQQMLTIARTLMGNPWLLLLDEPSEGLAPVIVEQMAHTIQDLKKEGLTILISEQNLHFADLVADRAFIVEKGETRYEGTMVELESNEEVKDTYLAV